MNMANSSDAESVDLDKRSSDEDSEEGELQSQDMVFVDDGPQSYQGEAGNIQIDADLRSPRSSDQYAGNAFAGAQHFGEEWVQQHHETFLDKVKSAGDNGYEECKWAKVLDYWSNVLKLIPFYKLPLPSIKRVLEHARLQQAATPQHAYELLRRLGSSILDELSDEGTLCSLKVKFSSPQAAFNETTKAAFNETTASIQRNDQHYADKMDKSEIEKQIKAMRGKDDPVTSTEEEENLGFVVLHVRSDRYYPIEIGAIIRYLVSVMQVADSCNETPRGKDSLVTRWKQLSKDLQDLDEKGEKKEQKIQEAQRFISNCYDAFHRAQIAFEKEEKRCWQLGVILMSSGPCQRHSETSLDRWHRQPSPAEVSIERHFEIIGEEKKRWKECVDEVERRLNDRLIDIPKKEHEMFKFASESVQCLADLAFLGNTHSITEMQQKMDAYAKKKRALAVLAEKVEIRECVKEVMNSFKADSGQEQNLADDRSGKGKPLVAVFGHAPVDALGEEAVIVRTVPLPSNLNAQSEFGDETISIIEIGLRLEGSYLAYEPQKEDSDSMVASSASIKVKREDMKFFKYIRPEHHVPHSKTIAELFQTSASEPAFTDVLLLIPEPDGQTKSESRNENGYSEVSDAGGRFMIDLKNPGTVRTDGANYYPIPIKPGPSTDDRGTAGLIPFQRLAVMLPPSIPPLYIHLHQKLPRSTIKGGFSESAEIIAQVLALAYGAKHGMTRSGSSTGQEQLKSFLKGNPLLLYYTTIELLNYFSDQSNNFAETVATFWADKLKTSDSRSFFSREEQESRLLVLRLITGGTTYVGNAQSVSCIALASEAHLKYLPGIISDETKFNQQNVVVEESNFESTLLRLRTISTASITFIFIVIAGRMSAYQVEQLVRAAANPIKLIFHHSHSLLSLLELTDVRDLIFRPESLKSGTKAERPCVVYLEDSPVGALVQYTTEEISKKPTALSEGQYWDKSVLEKRIDSWMQWKDSIVRWLEMEPTDEDKFSSFVRILVTAEPDATCASFKEQQESRFNAEVVQAGKDMDFHRLKAFLDNEHLPPQSHLASKVPIGGLPRFDAEPDLPKPKVLVLSEAHLLPHSRLEVLVSRCCVQRSKLLLLVNKATSVMSKFRVFEDIGAPPTWTHVPAIFQRLETQTNHSLCFRGLQLIFSHEVVTSDPKHVDTINKATGVEDDVNIDHLSFLDRKDTLQYRGYLKDLLDGLKREEPLVLQDKGTKEKGTTLAALLAAHARQYLLYPLDEEPEHRRDVSFKDFCSQPQVRFLGQIHRIEAYICFLFSKTKESKRYSSDASPTMPLGTPLTQKFVVLDNTHEGYSPGKILAAEFDPTSAATMASVRSPAYVDPGNGDAMLNMQEITEHRAISCEELHWNALVSRWKNVHDLTRHQMEHILKYSPSRISVLLSLSAHQIVTIPELSRSAYEAVKRDFFDSKTLLRMPSVQDFRELRTRVASICWLIMKTGTTLRDSDSKIDDLSTEFFHEDYSIMIEDGFKLNLEICPENLKLLSAFARAIIRLDRFDALTEQQTVANFIFSDVYVEDIEKVLDSEKIGAAFVLACVAHERVKAIIDGNGGKAIFQRFGALLQWVRDPSDANAAEMGQSLSVKFEGSTLSLSHRFSELAISAILQSVRTNQFSKVMQAACTHLLSICIQDRVPAAFWSEVLRPFCGDKSLRGRAVALVHAISTAKLETGDDAVLSEQDSEASEQWRFELPSSLHRDEPWESMCRAFRDASHAEELFRRASEQNFALPFNSSEHLCDLYVSYLSTRPIEEGSGREVAAEIKLHKGLIPDEVSKRATFNHMVRRSKQADPSNAELVLFWFTWWFDLASVLPHNMSPTRATWALFQDVLRELRAEIASSLSRLMLEESGLSTWARFMLAPYTLPVSIFNVLTLKVTEDESLLIRSQAFLLAQEGHEIWPAYVFRTHLRPLPPECIQALVQLVSKDRALPAEKATMKDMFPQTNLGVSPTTVEHNLTLLLNLNQPAANAKNQTFITLLVWFQAAGFHLKDLKGMCRNDEEKQLLLKTNETCTSQCRNSSFQKACVMTPLPVYVDVRFVSGRVVLFDTRPESRATTKQWISMLLTQYDVQDETLPERFERYAIARAGNQPFSRSEPNDIVRDLFRQVGAALTQRYENFTLSTTGSQSAVVDSLLPLGEFFSQLQISMDPERYDMLAAVAFEGLTLGLKSKKNDDLHVCIADGLFALLGITPLNGGMEIDHMLKAWKKQDLVCGASVLAEVDWMRKNVYATNDIKIATRLQGTSKPTTRPYERPSASQALINRLDDPTAGQVTYDTTYDFFGDVAKALQRDHVVSLLPPKHSEANPGPSHDPPALQEFHVPSFDHVPQSSPALAGQINAASSVSLFRRSKESAAVGQQSRMHGIVGTKAVELNKPPQTISARGLVHLQSRSRFGALKIQPGLHPILRSAGDERNTPVLQWREEQKKKDKVDARSSFDRGDADACTKIEHIFSHNGDTWDHLNKLPPDSTIVGRGFYLRKTERQGWMLLLGASDRKAVEKPPFWLWTLMDTMRLGSLDFDKDVVQILKSMVVIGFKVQKPDPEQLSDERFGDVLDEIRTCSLDDKDKTAYEAYLKREEKVCQHFKKVLRKLQGCQTSKPLLEMLDLVDLEGSLGSKGNFFDDQISQTLSRLLCIVCEKRDPVPRSQLIFCLDLALSNHWARSDGVSEQGRPGPSQDGSGASEGEHAALEVSLQKQKSDFHFDMSCDSQKIMNKQLAAHEHITKRDFRDQSVKYIEDLEQENQEDWRIVWTQDFYDSEDENDVLASQTFAGKAHAADGIASDSNDRHLDNAVTHTDLKERRVQARKYDDDDYDTPLTADSKRQQALLPTRWGYGVATSSTVRVLSLLSENVPLYFMPVDCRRLKIYYSDAEGLPIAMVFHKILLHRVLKEFAASLGSKVASTDAQEVKPGKILHFRQKMLGWLVDLVRSPLPLAAVYWFMDKVEHGATTLPVPFMGGDAQRESQDINLKVIAHCVANAIPKSMVGREVLMAFDLEPDLVPFCTRKNDTYGIHIVKGGTLGRLEESKVNVEVCELGYDALTQAKDNASMYLSIVNRFSKYTWIVYVTGLDSIDDALLKWLAEYTKLHPWRFVYLENTQTSWNFSENRDRCCYLVAPPTIESKIETVEHLQSEDVRVLRPHHRQPYDRLKVAIEDSGGSSFLRDARDAPTWDSLSSFCSTFFKSEPEKTASLDWKSLKPESMKKGERELRLSVGNIFLDAPDTPCVVLLCSPPGTGKSYFSEQLARDVKSQNAIIDGSDDRLVEMALREILEIELPDASKRLFLIVDEFHMLREKHKVDLFSWLQERARNLQVLLIANRKDARDEELLETFKKESGVLPERVQSITTRLSLTNLDAVMEEEGVKHKDAIRGWVHCARCLFGGEAVSLRNLKDLDTAIDDPRSASHALERLLLDKRPIISKATAQDFVACFIMMESRRRESRGASDTRVVEAVANIRKGPVSLMFQAALCTEKEDRVGMDYPDFVAFGLPFPYDAPPSLRIAAWCCHMRAAAGATESKQLVQQMDSPESIFGPMLVDQCGFPLQLLDQHLGPIWAGLAFSWSGDYSQLPEITNAVKRGHSVDWNGVRRRCWEHDDVQDSSAFVELLSVCTSPGKVLEALNKKNLCDLLRKSSPSDSLRIARCVLENQTHREDRRDHPNPYRTAIWMIVLHDKKIANAKDLLAKMSSTSDSRAGEDELVDVMKWASVQMRDMIDCNQDDDPENKTALLVGMLIHLSDRSIAAGNPHKVHDLWLGIFAPLLQVCLPAAGLKGHPNVVVAVAIHCVDQNEKWPGPVRALWSIAHGQGTADHVSNLWGDLDLRRLLFAGPGARAHVDEEQKPPIQRDLAGGILAVAGVIPPSIQEVLLVRGGDANLDSFADDMDRAMTNIIDTIEKIATDKDRDFKLAKDTEFERLVTRTARSRFGDREDGEDGDGIQGDDLSKRGKMMMGKLG